MPSKRWILLNHWRAKLASLALAVVLWLVIKHGIAYTPTLPAPVPSFPLPAPPVTPSPRV